jgi:hypothetical protein
MPTYLVRTIEGPDLVGIFVAPDLFSLALLVDECTDPGSCEFQRMKPGGIMWTAPAVAVPIELGDDDDDLISEDPIPWSQASLTESWWESFTNGTGKGNGELLSSTWTISMASTLKIQTTTRRHQRHPPRLGRLAFCHIVSAKNDGAAPLTVPELTRRRGIQLNKRVSLRSSADRLLV